MGTPYEGKAPMNSKIVYMVVLSSVEWSVMTSRKKKMELVEVPLGSGWSVKTSRKKKMELVEVPPDFGWSEKTSRRGKKAPVGVPPGFE